MSEDLIIRLRAALDEDERIALATKLSANDDGDWMVSTNPDRNDAVTGVLGQCIHIGMIEQNGDLDDRSQAEHIARHNPARTLAMVATHREILKLHSPITTYECTTCYESYSTYPCPTIKALAKGYGIEVE